MCRLQGHVLDSGHERRVQGDRALGTGDNPTSTAVAHADHLQGHAREGDHAARPRAALRRHLRERGSDSEEQRDKPGADRGAAESSHHLRVVVGLRCLLDVFSLMFGGFVNSMM